MSCSGGDIRIFNNRFYAENNKALINTQSVGEAVQLVNNVFFQAGTGDVMEWQTNEPVHHSNRYSFPHGSRGIDLGNGETDGDPAWLNIPNGTYSGEFFKLTGPLTGIDLSDFFTTDFNLQARSNWDMGAYEFVRPSLPLTGDLNQDDVIDEVDIRLCVDVVLGIERDAEIVRRADVDENGKVDAVDLQWIVNRDLED